MRALTVILILGLAAGLAACDTVEPDAFVDTYVVESYQIAGKPIAPVRLSRLAPIDQRVDPRQLAVRGADVRVEWLSEDGEILQTFVLIETSEGNYGMAHGAPIIQGGGLYRLQVTAPNGDRISSTTRVPGEFEIVSANASTIRYLGPEQLTLRLTPSIYPGRQSVYILTSTTLDGNPSNLTPPYRRLYDEGAFSLEELRVGSSPILNEANYDRDADGFIVVRLPWLAVPFFGRSRIAIHVIDTNLFDVLRTQSVQQGGSTLPPGEIPNVIDHVDGGTGVFGSMASREYDVTVVP